MSWKILTKIWCQTIWGSEKFRATKNQNIFQLQSQPRKETVEFAAAAATTFEDRSKASWFCLRLPYCSPRFESQAYHLRFFQFVKLWWEKDENKQKRGRDCSISFVNNTEIGGSSLFIDRFYFLSTIKKEKTKEKRPGIGHLNHIRLKFSTIRTRFLGYESKWAHADHYTGRPQATNLFYYFGIKPTPL